MSISSNDSRSPFHPVHVGYLVTGLVLLGVSGTWALVVSGTVDSDQLGWLLPLLLVGAGVIGLVAGAAKGLSARRSRPEPTFAEADETAPLYATSDAPYDPFSPEPHDGSTQSGETR